MSKAKFSFFLIRKNNEPSGRLLDSLLIYYYLELLKMRQINLTHSALTISSWDSSDLLPSHTHQTILDSCSIYVQDRDAALASCHLRECIPYIPFPRSVCHTSFYCLSQLYFYPIIYEPGSHLNSLINCHFELCFSCSLNWLRCMQTPYLYAPVQKYCFNLIL